MRWKRKPSQTATGEKEKAKGNDAQNKGRAVVLTQREPISGSRPREPKAGVERLPRAGPGSTGLDWERLGRTGEDWEGLRRAAKGCWLPACLLVWWGKMSPCPNEYHSSRRRWTSLLIAPYIPNATLQTPSLQSSHLVAPSLHLIHSHRHCL